MEVTIDAKGIEEATKALDPKHVYNILMKWYDRGTKYAQGEMQKRAPGSIKVIVRMDAMRPPRWARVRPKGSLGTLMEAGTGPAGAAGFRHVARHFPRVTGKGSIQERMSLPTKADAFLIARSIARRGGNPAKPFVQPTYLATKGYLEQLAGTIIQEELDQ